MDVPADTPVIRFVFDQFRFEPPLEHVARAPMPLAPPIGIATQPLLHSPGEVRLRSAQKEVNVIPHESKAEDLPPVSIHRPRESIHKSLVVCLVADNVVPPVAARHHMIDRTGEFETQRSSHASNLAACSATDNRKKKK